MSGSGRSTTTSRARQDLFDEALEEVLEEHGALFDALTGDMDDPAEVFASATRMTVRMVKTHPQIAKILQRTGLAYLFAPQGLGPRACGTCNEPRTPARFRIDDPKVALACAGGATLGVLSLTMSNPKPKAVDAAADELVTNLLRMFGLPDDEAREIAHRPLPKP
jgi:hypothetical protein